MKRLIFVTALLLPIGSWATDEFGYYRPYFMINKNFDYATCEGFVTATKFAKQGHYNPINQFNQWLDGFLTAYDMYTPDTFDIAYGKDLATLDGIIENYCAKHPDHLLDDAAQSLIFELIPDRAKTRP